MKKIYFIVIALLLSVGTMRAVDEHEHNYAHVGKVNGFLSKNVKLTGYSQFGYSYSDLESNKVENQFYMKLVLLALSGNITDNLSWMVDFEAVTPRVLDAYIYYKPFTFFRIKAGQMRTAFTLVNQMSMSLYETVNWDRTLGCLVARTSGDVLGKKSGRDLGIQFDGEAFKMPFDKYFLEYRLGIYNGSGMNTKENNEAKDVSAWLTLQPVNGFKVGASAYFGRLNTTLKKPLEGGDGSEFTTYNANVRRNRQAVSAIYQNKNLTLRSEYLWGQDDNVHREGFYVFGHWFVWPSRLALLGRIEGYEADKKNSNYEMIYTVGANYHLTSKTRFMLNYVRSHYQVGKAVNELWAQFQIGF